MKEFICICCPRGCHLKVDDELNVTGNSCLRGKEYGKSEASNPVRVVTSFVLVKDKVDTVVSVKTSNPIPKGKIFDVMKEIQKTKVTSPIHVGDIIIKNVLNLNVDIIATKEII